MKLSVFIWLVEKDSTHHSWLIFIKVICEDSREFRRQSNLLGQVRSEYTADRLKTGCSVQGKNIELVFIIMAYLKKDWKALIAKFSVSSREEIEVDALVTFGCNYFRVNCVRACLCVLLSTHSICMSVYLSVGLSANLFRHICLTNSVHMKLKNLKKIQSKARGF